MLRVQLDYLRRQRSSTSRLSAHPIRRLVLPTGRIEKPQRWLARVEKTASLPVETSGRRRIPLRIQTTVLGKLSEKSGSVIVLGKSKIVGLDRIVIATDDILTTCLGICRIEKARIELENFGEVFYRFLIVLLLLGEFSSRVQRDRILVVRLYFNADLLLHLVDFASCQQPVILGSSVPTRGYLTGGVIIRQAPILVSLGVGVRSGAQLAIWHNSVPLAQPSTPIRWAHNFSTIFFRLQTTREEFTWHFPRLWCLLSLLVLPLNIKVACFDRALALVLCKFMICWVNVLQWHLHVSQIAPVHRWISCESQLFGVLYQFLMNTFITLIFREPLIVLFRHIERLPILWIKMIHLSVRWG